MKLNDRVHVVETNGEAHNAWFVGESTDNHVIIELDDNCFTELRVPRTKVRRKWLLSAL